MAKKYKKFVPRKKDYSALISLIIVIVILFVGVILTIRAFTSENETGIVDKPEVTAIVGDENGTVSRTFKTKMSFEGDVKGLNSISNEDYKRIVSETLNSIGYEKLSGDNGYELIKTEMKKRISSKLKDLNVDDFEIKEIYISDLSETKYPAPGSNTNKPNSSDVADMFKTK